MRRGIHIAVTLFAVVALITPLDCLTSGVWTREAAACCLRGECHPGANADDCCKNNVPESAGLVAVAATAHQVPLVMATVAASATGLLAPVFQRLTCELGHPPPLQSLATVNLPLLI